MVDDGAGVVDDGAGAIDDGAGAVDDGAGAAGADADWAHPVNVTLSTRTAISSADVLDRKDI